MLSFRSLSAACVLISCATLLSADDDEPIAATVEYETLVAFGKDVFDTDLYKDNYFQYEEFAQALATQAQEMAGSAIEVTAQVTRVTPVEVIVEVEDAGRMKMVLRHDRPPIYGNLGTRWYGGTRASEYAFLMSKPVGLRIDGEIDLEVAKTLRRGDILTIAGKIEKVPVRIHNVFQPYAAAIVTSWQVTAVTPGSNAKTLRY